MKKKNLVIYMVLYYCIFIAMSVDVTNVSLIQNGVISGINLIPTSTIKEYVVNYSNYNSFIILKFFANFVYFMPFAALFFTYRQKSNMECTFLNYIVLFALVFLSDFLLFTFKVGVFDIDAVLLRYLGTVTIYGILMKRREQLV